MATKESNFVRGFKMMLGGAVSKALSIPFVSSVTGRYSYLTNSLLNRDFLKEYKNWVYACVQARSEEVGNIQLKLLGKGDKEVKTSPVLDLLSKVNPVMTKSELFTATQAFLDLDGNAFWFLAREGDTGVGAVKEIYILRPDKVQLVQSKVNPLMVEGYIFTQPDGKKIPFEPTEILHFKNFNPLGNHPFPHRGMGVVEAAAWAIDTDNEARTWNYNFFKNSARPDGILTTAGDTAADPAEYQRLQEEWNAKHQGADNANKVAILGGGMTWTEISRTQKDMDFLGQRTFSRDEILALFRVPKSIIGITDDVNRANADAAIYVFALRTVKPLMQQMVDTLNEFLVPEFGDGLKLDFESPVAEDRKASLDEYTAALPAGVSWLTVNEIREREGLEKMEGGDILYVPFNVVPADLAGDDTRNPGSDPAAGDPTVPVAPTEPAAPADEPADDPKKGVAANALEKLLLARKTSVRLPNAQKFHKKGQLGKLAVDKYVEMWKAHINISSAPLEKKLKTFFEKQKKEVLRNTREQLKGFAADEFKHKSLFDFLFDESDAIAASVSLITPFIQDYINRSGENATALIGGDSFDPNTGKLQAFVKARAQYFAETINGTTREELLRSIQEGVDAGESLDDIEQRIGSVYETATTARVQMIARTEVSAASNQGAIGAYQQAGIEKVQWQVVNPDDEDCIENDGIVVRIGETFPSGDTEPPVHPNCECTTIPVFND